VNWRGFAKRGPKWLVRLTQRGVTIEHSGRLDAATLAETWWSLAPRAADVVPNELVLTNREVLLLLLLYGNRRWR
jgi:hypothetical protein